MSHWVLMFPNGSFAKGRASFTTTPILDEARVFTSRGAASNSYPQRYSAQRHRIAGAKPVRVRVTLQDD